VWSTVLPLVAVALTVPAVAPVPAGADAARAPTPGQAGGVTIELVGQTPMVNPGGRIDFQLAIEGAPADGFVQLEVHGRVATRSEFVRSIDGEGLRSTVSNVSPMRLAELRADATDGTRRVPLFLDPDRRGGIPITLAGAYPVRIRVTDADASTLATLLTHIVVVDDTDESPPLAVAVVADLAVPPALQADGEVRLRTRRLERLSSLLNALMVTPELPLNLSISPETLDALEADRSDESTFVLEQLRETTRGRTVLGVPYTDVSTQALTDAGIADELDLHLARGRSVLGEELGVEPVADIWLTDDDLGPSGARTLADRGIQHLVVRADQVEELPAAPLSLAQRFDVALPEPGGGVPGASGPTGTAGDGIDAIEVDSRLAAHLRDDGPPAEAAQRLLAELAVIWIERPATSRAAVLVVDGTTRPDVLAGVLRGLDAGGVIEAVSLPEAFYRADRFTDPSGEPIVRELTPTRAEAFDDEVVTLLGGARTRLRGFESLIGPDNPRALPLQAQVLLSTARGLDTATRIEHLDAVSEEVDRVVAAVHVPEQPRVTLTSRVASIPLTIENDAGFPLEVVIHLDSQKLEFPDGSEIPVVLDAATTRLDLRVRTLATGGFPLDVRVTSPDGALELTSTRYRMQSTAVSGVGLFISVGAGLFLLAWWISHWHRTRRSRRLVPLEHDPAPAVE
jgi:hypothetical protein